MTRHLLMAYGIYDFMHVLLYICCHDGTPGHNYSYVPLADRALQGSFKVHNFPMSCHLSLLTWLRPQDCRHGNCNNITIIVLVIARENVWSEPWLQRLHVSIKRVGYCVQCVCKVFCLNRVSMQITLDSPSEKRLVGRSINVTLTVGIQLSDGGRSTSHQVRKSKTSPLIICQGVTCITSCTVCYEAMGSLTFVSSQIMQLPWYLIMICNLSDLSAHARSRVYSHPCTISNYTIMHSSSSRFLALTTCMLTFEKSMGECGKGGIGCHYLDTDSSWSRCHWPLP